MKQPRIIRSEDADAIPQLEAKIAEAEKLQASMKAANKIVRDRKLSDDEKVARLTTECELQPDSARKLLKPDFMGRIGYPDYALTNNGANIRRMQQRLKSLVREGSRGSVTVEFSGGRVEDSAEDSRVRIFHDAKPSTETIAKLKAFGFHWTPSRQCWHRLRNDSARSAAAQLTGIVWPETEGPAVGEALPATREVARPAAMRP